MLKDPLEYTDTELKSLSPKELNELKLKTIDLVDKFNTEQLTKKILINSLYGATGNKFFSLYNPDYASAVTSNGRIFIQQTANMLRERFQKLIPWDKEYIIYGDTDSVYYTIEPFVNKYLEKHPNADTQELTDFCLEVAEKIVQPVIDTSIKTIAERFNCQDSSRMGAKVEVVCDSMINCQKKKYYARVRDEEGVRLDPNNPYIKIMGLELKKSTTPKWVKDTISDAIPILFDGTEKELKDWIKKIKNTYLKAPLWDIAQVASASSLDFKLGDKNIPFGSRIAIIYNQFIKAKNLETSHSYILEREKFRFLRLVKTNPFGTDAIAFKDNKFAEKFLKQYIDYDSMFEKTFLSALSLMCECMGYDVFEKVKALDEW